MTTTKNPGRPGRPITTKGPVSDLAKVYPNGVLGLAARLNVHRSTLVKWRKKGRVSKPYRDPLAKLMEEYGINIEGRTW